MAKPQVAIQPCSLIYVTLPTCDQAETLARQLLRECKIACATLLPRVTNLFYSRGTIRQFQETLLLCKTTKEQTCAAIEFIATCHPYDMCEVFSLPMECGNESYFGFINYAVLGGAQGQTARAGLQADPRFQQNIGPSLETSRTVFEGGSANASKSTSNVEIRKPHSKTKRNKWHDYQN